MKLFLETHGDQPRVVELDEPEAEDSHHAPRSGLGGWVAHKVEHLKARWHEARGGITGTMHRVWDWLHRGLPTDEPTLARLRKAHCIEIHHSPVLADEDARRLWTTYLARRKRRHLPRFLVNALIAPLTIVLVPLPGPNIIGYWFAYRALHHGLILYGLRHVRTNQVEMKFVTVEREPALSAESERSGAGEDGCGQTLVSVTAAHDRKGLGGGPSPRM